MIRKKQMNFFNSSSIYIFSSIITNIIVLGTLPIFTRNLSPSDYGIIALFILFGNVTSSLLSLGLNHSSYRYYFELKNNHKEFKKLNSSNLFLMIIIYLLCYLILNAFVNQFSESIFDGKLSSYLILLSFISGCLGQLYISLTLILTAQERPVTFSLVTIAQAFLKTIFALYLIFQYSLTYLSIIYGTLLSQIIIFVYLIYIQRDIIGFHFSFSAIKKSIIYSYPRIPRQIIGITGQSVDKYLLNKYSGLRSLGNYTFGVKFATLLQMIHSGIEKVWTPFFMNKSNEGTKKARFEIVNRYYNIIFFIVFVGLLMIYFSEEMIKLLTTKEFYPAMFVTPIYVFFSLFGVLGIAASTQLMYIKKLIYFLPVSALNVLMLIILNLSLIPKIGAIGAAISAAISALFSNTLLFYFAQKKYPLPFKVGKIFNIFFSVIIFTIPIYPIMSMDLNFLLKLLLKIFLVFIFVIFCLRFNLVEKKYFNLIYLKKIILR